MFYDRLKKSVRAYVRTKAQTDAQRRPISDHIAPAYMPLHEDVVAHAHESYFLPGGRGSGKSSYISLEVVDGIMKDSTANAIIFRKYGVTLRESVFSQIQWAIDELGASALWRANVSPMVYTYLPTGQQIYFRGLDDAGKLKSIKPRHGRFAFVWFEEFSELDGPNQVRSVLQSVVRGGNDFRIFASFNPPISQANWANKHVLIPNPRALTFKTDYRDMPPEWLGESFLLEAERLKEINPRAYEHEYLGTPTGTGGEVFPNIEPFEIEDADIEQMGYFYAGLDFGFSVDPAAFVVLSYDRRTGTIYIVDELYQRGLTNAQLADAIKAKGYMAAQYSSIFDPAISASSTTESSRKYVSIIADSAEPKSIQDMKNAGFTVFPCKKYHGSVIYGIRWLQSKRIIIDPRRCPHCWEESSSYEYMTTKDGEFLASVRDENNHCIDAVRYSLDRLINDRHESA